MLLALGALPCNAVTGWEFAAIDRAGGNEVDCLNFAWVEGAGSELYRSWVGSSFGVDSTTFYTETWAHSAWGGQASIQWERQPSQTGPGTYWGWFNAAFEYYLGGWTYNGWDEMLLPVQRPTIYGLNGAWYFGPTFVSNNGYYDATQLTANPNYADPETDPYWIVTNNDTKVELTCTHCAVTDAYSKGDTYPCSMNTAVKFRVSVGGQNGFLSDEHWLVIDTPYQLYWLQDQTQDVGISSPVTGFLSYIKYQTVSKCNQYMFDIAMNEQFTGAGGDVTNAWSAPTEQNWSSMDGYTFTDGIGFACNGCTPSPEWPGPLQSPPKGLSSTKVDWSSQSFRSGSDQSGSGVLIQNDRQQRYLDHGRPESIVSPVN